ncbi:hypothetical protein ON010_g17226 [Phytophthora cinnamomi]|nr:hypothetical protein ON010_g17226 [Phytophthora cinnamomi]
MSRSSGKELWDRQEELWGLRLGSGTAAYGDRCRRGYATADRSNGLTTSLRLRLEICPSNTCKALPIVCKRHEPMLLAPS